MLRTELPYDPEDYVTHDVGIASDQYNRWIYSPPVQAHRKAEAKQQQQTMTRTREFVILGAIFMGLFALERIMGGRKSLEGPRNAASGAAITTAARAAAGAA